MSLHRTVFSAVLTLAVVGAPAAFPQAKKDDKGDQARQSTAVVKSKSNISNNREAGQGDANGASSSSSSKPSGQTKQSGAKKKDASKK
jgi:hypothetical protein